MEKSDQNSSNSLEHGIVFKHQNGLKDNKFFKEWQKYSPTNKFFKNG